MTEKEILRRWAQYRHANTYRPEARERELRHLFSLLNPAEGERIWEVGTGNGYLTFPLAEAVGSTGRVFTTDVVESNVSDVVARNKDRGLPIEAQVIGGSITVLSEMFDAVASIATLHHYDNRTEDTGEKGRRVAFKDFFQALRPGGRIVISDVLHGTRTQRYFDSIDDPRLCAPHGHPHDFFTKESLIRVAQEAGFKSIAVSIESVPWQFESPAQAKHFIHTIHNARCSPEESFEIAQNILGFQQGKTHYELGWNLFYLTATKS